MVRAVGQSAAFELLGDQHFSYSSPLRFSAGTCRWYRSHVTRVTVEPGGTLYLSGAVSEQSRRKTVAQSQRDYSERIVRQVCRAASYNMLRPVFHLRRRGLGYRYSS